jgi:glutamine synthetase type III
VARTKPFSLALNGFFFRATGLSQRRRVLAEVFVRVGVVDGLGGIAQRQAGRTRLAVDPSS